MGGKDSKPSCIVYEEALKRVSEAEVKRLRDAFKRASTLNGTMTKAGFVKEVLGDGIPAKLAEHIYQACGGNSKGISFKELVCGLVLLTRGYKDEKIRFIFGLYSNETGSYVSKDDMVQLAQVCEGGYVSEAIAECFIEGDRVNFEEFTEWLLGHPDATSLTRWLLAEPCTVSLSNDLETPTFYQTLAGVTHLEEADIIELEKRYWMLKAYSKTGKFDVETFSQLVCPPIPQCLCEGFFNAFDENRDDHIDFKEMACGISACCRGPVVERQKFCFKIFNSERDGMLNPNELRKMLSTLLYVQYETQYLHRTDETDDHVSIDLDSALEDILTRFDNNCDGAITLDEYLVWAIGHPLPLAFLNLLFQVCHVVLGLKPATKEDEGIVIRDWLDREERYGLQPGQVWYLVSMEWWRTWHEYINWQQHAPNMLSAGYSNGNYSSWTGSLERSKPSRNNMERSPSYSDDLEIFNDSDDSVQPTNKCPNSVSNVFHFFRSSVSGQSSSPTSGSSNSSPKTSRKVVPLGVSQSQFYVGPQRPPAIDNSGLVVSNVPKVPSLTGEGGKLRRNLSMARGRDFEMVPEPVWRALSQWYGGIPALPRQVIQLRDGTLEVEMYPLCLRLLRHQTPSTRTNNNAWAGAVGGYGGTTYSYHSMAQPTPRKFLAYTASFSRLATLKQLFDFLCRRLRIRLEDVRLWHYKDENNMQLLEEEMITLEELYIEDNDQILIEVRNKDQTWPEEMFLLNSRTGRFDRKRQVPTERGATGLNNLGNTCFMNAALQCVSNTRPLTQYFNKNMHLYELNRNNPLGMKGVMAKRYGDLAQDLWSGTSKTIAPLKLRWTIGKYAPRFNGFQQHDSQELLAFLLDGLHEDLNRVHDKPYVGLKDSDGRSDVIVAHEAWENHILRNRSIIVDLFHGQLKSCVRCKVCGHDSVRFDPFNYLSLPLPMESCICLEVVLIRLDGSIPVKYGIRLNANEKYSAVKKQLSELSNIPVEQLLLAEITSSMIRNIPPDEQRIKTAVTSVLFAYEIPGQRAMFYLGQSREAQTFTQIQRMDRTGIYSRLCSRPLDQDVQNSGPQLKNGEVDDNCDKVGADEGIGGEESPPSVDENVNNELEIQTVTGLSNHNRNASNVSAVSNGSNSLMSSSFTMAGTEQLVDPFSGFVVAIHRKMMRQDIYFLSYQKSKPSVFGVPLILPCLESTTQQDLYQATWLQVSHLVSPLPPSDSNVPNHAQDCDDSLGYEYPFILKAVRRDGLVCAWCPWYRFCRGCKIECNEINFNFASSFIAIDWDPTALHLRYQSSQERLMMDHESVEKSRRLQSDPIDLDSCLKAFTKEEELGEDEKYYCSKCKLHQLASKKLQIWRLPPILIVHLKRFQSVNGHWVKSQKIVKFPYNDFNPTNYLATIPRMAVLHRKQQGLMSDAVYVFPSASSSSGVDSEMTTPTTTTNGSTSPGSRSRTVSPANSSLSHFQLDEDDEMLLSDVRTPTDDDDASTAPTVIDLENKVVVLGKVNTASTNSDFDPASPNCEVPGGAFQDFHQHRLMDGYDPFDLNYKLYAISCHSGILGGGHYVCYACNPNNSWYCYNDSSCKEVSVDQIDSDSAYMLFYERDGIDYESYLPNVSGKIPDNHDIDDDIETDFKRMCRIQ